MIELVDYCGLKAPRHQRCAFCKCEYDAAEGPNRPHAVCEKCWPAVLEIERAQWEDEE